MSNEEMLAHYDAGIVTRSELLCYLALNLSLQNWMATRGLLARRGWLDEFEPLLEAIETRAEFVAGGSGQVRVASEAALAAVKIWRADAG